jgi:hypothetical protein
MGRPDASMVTIGRVGEAISVVADVVSFRFKIMLKNTKATKNTPIKIPTRFLSIFDNRLS